MAWKSLLVLLAHGVVADLNLSFLGGVGPFDAAAGDICVAGDSVASSCLAKPSFTQLPVISQASCLCCVGSSNIASQYMSCASYIKTAAPKATDQYSVELLLASVCSDAGALCGGGGGGGGGATTTRATGAGSSPASRTVTATAEPTACLSVNAVISSCIRAVPSFTSLPASEQASCLCYNSIGGSFTTSFDKHAASCVSYLKTASPTEYSDVASLTTFCAQRTPSSDDKSSAGTDFFSAPTPTPTPTPISSSGGALPTAARTPSSSSSTAQAGQLMVASGPTAWATNFFTFLLSFFILM